MYMSVGCGAACMCVVLHACACVCVCDVCVHVTCDIIYIMCMYDVCDVSSIIICNNQNIYILVHHINHINQYTMMQDSTVYRTHIYSTTY